MKLTPVERTVLLNQFRILDKVDPKGGWKGAVKVFEYGFVAEYRQYIDTDEEISEAVSEECFDIMSMFRALDHAGSKVRFSGFDGNNETNHYAFVRHLWETNRFTESKHDDNDGGNSHTPMLGRYRRMVEVWRGSAYPPTKEVQAKIEAAARGA
jgi:uncharacterized protein YfbU (UPF0304 family)